MPPRGLLIVIEGLDRSGKSTQCQRLLERLLIYTNDQARLQKFPDRTTPTGTLINAYLTKQTGADDHAIHLIFSANRWEKREGILRDLERGVSVVVDRYSFSGAVYSAAKGLPGLGLEWAWSCEVGLPRPDVVVFLDVAEEVARERGGFGEERYEVLSMQRRVRKLFGEMEERVGGVVWRRVDAGDGVGEVEERVWEVVMEVERGVREGELARLEALKGEGELGR